MKKLIKRIITTCLSLLFIVLSLITVTALEAKTSSASLSFSASAIDNTIGGVQTRAMDDTMFLIEPDIVRTSGKYIYVYDKAESTIKVIDKDTNTYKEANNHYITALGVDDILISNDALFLFNKQSGSFTCIDAEDFESLTFEHSSLSYLSSAKFIKHIKIGEDDYMLTCPENPITADFEFAKITRTDSSLSIDSVSKFRISSNFQDSLSSYNEIFVDSNDEKLFLMLINESNNILSCQIDPTSVETVQVQMTGVTGFDSGNNILDVSSVKITDKDKVVAVTTQNTIEFFELSISSSQVSMTSITDMQISIESGFVPTDAHGTNKTLALVSNSSQELKIINFDKEIAPYYYKQEIKNPTINRFLYSHNDFTYLKVINDTPILSLPYSKEGQIEANVNDEVVVIGEGQDENQNKVYGWYYVLYSKDNVNYYGYIASIDTNQKTETSYEKNYVTVIAYTKLYTYPSKITDEINVAKPNQNNVNDPYITKYSRIEVLDSLCDYTSLGTKYLKVKVNGVDIGFIDRESVIVSSDNSGRIIPNATVTHNNSEIFTSTDTNRQTIDLLDKGKRVKVIGKRDTKTNFTLITYNDNEGNECTGYIYTYNLETDSWTMLQTIGILLVIINVILLIIIICLKNKFTR